MSKGNGNSMGASSYNGHGPSALIITGTRLQSGHWWWLA